METTNAAVRTPGMNINRTQLPDFLVIGAGKSGTTSLDKYLDQNPAIYMSKRKEPNFFALEDMPLEEKLKNPYYMASVTEIVDYVNLFQGASDSQLKGETSPMYMYNEGAAARIKRYLPDVKLIAILRHPVDRLYSRYLHLAREDRLPTKQFSDALDKSTIWWQRGDLVHEGFFGQHLERYYRLFDSSQIRVCFFDQLSRNPQSLLDDIFAFLEVDPCGTIKHDIVYNKSGLKKSRLYDRILGHKSILKTTAKKIFPSIYSKAKQSAPLLRLVTAVQDANLAHPRLDPALRLEMIDKIYREDILKLQKLLSIDLSDWLK